jgi:hypothetical protein
VCEDRDLPRAGGGGAGAVEGEEMAVSAKEPRDLPCREINCSVWNRMQTSCRRPDYEGPFISGG